MAEREGFEPSRGFWPPTGLANPPLQPLGYLSVVGAEGLGDGSSFPRVDQGIAQKPLIKDLTLVFETNGICGTL